MRKEADIICLIDLQDFAEDQPLKILAHAWLENFNWSA